MLYTIIAEDKENSLQERLEKRPEHLVRINELVDKGRLVIAGGIQPSMQKILALQVLLAVLLWPNLTTWTKLKTGLRLTSSGEKAYGQSFR